jgi:hypothetical protein
MDPLLGVSYFVGFEVFTAVVLKSGEDKLDRPRK